MACQLKLNQQNCTCTYPGCSRQGKCCDCLNYHKGRGELPGCLFPPEIEATYNRSIEKFIETNQ